MHTPIINLHQRCGYSDSPFLRIHYFYTAGSGNGLEEVDTVCPGKLTPRKRHFFVTEKYIEDARQDEKHVPDLLEAIIQPPGPVKEELRQKLFKMTKFEPKIKKIRVCTFQMSGKIPDSTNVAFEDTFLQYLAPLGAKYMEKIFKNAGSSLKGWLP